MEIKANILNKSFLETRAVFSEDSQLKDEKKGIRCHSFLTACFLKLFGKSPVKLKVSINGKQTSIYVNRNSLKNWMERHHQNSHGCSKWNNEEWQDSITTCLKQVKPPQDEIPQVEQPPRVEQPRGERPSELRASLRPSTPLQGNLERPDFVPTNRLHINPRNLKPNQYFQVFVKPLDGPTMTVEVSSDINAKAETFLSAISSKLGLPTTRFRVVMAGKCLNPELPLRDYQLHLRGCIHVVQGASIMREILPLLNQFIIQLPEFDEESFEEFEAMVWSFVDRIFRGKLDTPEQYNNLTLKLNNLDAAIRNSDYEAEVKNRMIDAVNQMKLMLTESQTLYKNGIKQIKGELHQEFDNRLEEELAHLPPPSGCLVPANTQEAVFNLKINFEDGSTETLPLSKRVITTTQLLPYFQGLLRMNADKNEVELGGISRETVNLLKTFFSTGNLAKEKIKPLAEAALVELYETANQLELNHLAVQIVQEISSRLIQNTWTNKELILGYRNENGRLGALLGVLKPENRPV